MQCTDSERVRARRAGRSLASLAAIVLAAALPGTAVVAQADLFPMRTYEVGYKPRLLAAAHLNADARADLVSGNYSSVTTLLSLGDGKLQVQPEFFLNSVLQDVLAVDMNGDGFDDVVTLHAGSSSVRVYLSDGAGGLALAAEAAVGSNPWSLAAGDLDEDGKADIVTANDGNDTVSVLRGLGNGTLAPAMAFAVHSSVPGWAAQPHGLAVADLNEDEHLDIVTANWTYPSSYSVLIGNGEGSFATAVNTQTTPDAAWAGSQVEVGDMNGDGHVDLVLGGMSCVRLGDGSGTFATLLPAIAYDIGQLADVNQDGKLDVISAYELTVTLGNGLGGALSSTKYLTGSGGYGVTLADVDGDGHLDAAAANEAGGDVALLLGEGTGGFPQPPSYPTGGSVPLRLAVADLDDDGAADALSLHANTTSLNIQLGDGAAGFAAPTLVPIVGTPTDFGVADLDGDGDEDAVALSRTGSTSSAVVLAGDGAGSLTARVPFGLGVLGDAMALDDVDEDGHVDLLVVNRTPPGLAVRLGDGAGSFGAAMTTAMSFDAAGSSVSRLLLSRMNGDAHLDVVVSQSQGKFSIRYGDGHGAFGVQLPYTGLGRMLVLADLDGDGDRDVVGQSDGTGIAGVMFSALGGFTLPVFPGDLRGAPAVGDLDADGDPDIAVAGGGLATYGCLLGNGAGGFTLHGTFLAGGDPIDTAIEDLDGDGFPELVGLCSPSGTPFPEHLTVLFNETPSAWLGLGHSLAGSNGAPKLSGKGALTPVSPLTLTIEHGKSLGLATLAFGPLAIDAPFKGGTFVPLPTVLIPGLPLDGSGHFAGSGTWYGGLPPGTTVIFQAWMQDAAGPLGWSATNGLQGTTP